MRIVVLFVALMITCSVSGYGQGEVITKAEFDGINNNSTHPNMRWNGRHFRAVITTETSATIGPQFDHKSKFVTEYGPNGATRSLHESQTGSSEARRSETIRIGDAVYSRTGNGVWSRKDSKIQEKATEVEQRPSSHELDVDAEYRFLGTEEFRGKTAKVYQRVETRNRVDTKSGEVVVSTSTTKYWFDAEGTMLKSVFRSDSKRKDLVSRTGVVMEYELDPAIKITAPVLP